MLVTAIAINRWVLRHEYPTFPHLVDNKKYKHSVITQPVQRAGISEQDVEQALANMDMFMDVSTGDLSKLLIDAQLQSFKRNRGNITCVESRLPANSDCK